MPQNANLGPSDAKSLVVGCQLLVRPWSESNFDARVIESYCKFFLQNKKKKYENVKLK